MRYALYGLAIMAASMSPITAAPLEEPRSVTAVTLPESASAADTPELHSNDARSKMTCKHFDLHDHLELKCKYSTNLSQVKCKLKAAKDNHWWSWHPTLAEIDMKEGVAECRVVPDKFCIPQMAFYLLNTCTVANGLGHVATLPPGGLFGTPLMPGNHTHHGPHLHADVDEPHKAGEDHPAKKLPGKPPKKNVKEQPKKDTHVEIDKPSKSVKIPEAQPTVSVIEAPDGPPTVSVVGSKTEGSLVVETSDPQLSQSFEGSRTKGSITEEATNAGSSLSVEASQTVASATSMVTLLPATPPASVHYANVNGAPGHEYYVSPGMRYAENYRYQYEPSYEEYANTPDEYYGGRYGNLPAVAYEADPRTAYSYPGRYYEPEYEEAPEYYYPAVATSNGAEQHSNVARKLDHAPTDEEMELLMSNFDGSLKSFSDILIMIAGTADEPNAN